MALDGLGLVFEKQGNTGAAAYNEPVFKIGENPLDDIAAQIARQNQLTLLQKQKEKAAQEKAAQDALTFDVDAWDYDNKAYISGATNALMEEGARLKAAGKDFNNLADPEIKKFNQAKARLMQAGEYSVNQGKQLDAILKTASENPDKYDYEKTLQKFKEYQAMTPIQRVDYQMTDVLVPKEKPYDMFQLVNEMPLDSYYQDVSFENEKFKSSSKKFKMAELQKSIEEQADNPKYKEHYEKGLQNGLWTNKQEYAKVQLEEAKRREKLQKSYEQKPPETDWSMEYINGKSGDELIGEIGTGGQKVKVVSEKNGTKDVYFAKSTQLGDFNAVVADAAMIDAETGKPLTGAGTKNIKSGAIMLTPVYKGTNTPYPLSGEDQAKLVADGVIEYKPMVLGKAEEESMGIKTQKTVWVPSEAVAMNTGESKTMSKAQRAHIAYSKAAQETNERLRQQGVAKKNQGKTKTEYKLNGKTYTISQIEKAAKQSGVTVQEYINSVGLK